MDNSFTLLRMNINKRELWQEKAKRLFRERKIFHKDIAVELGLKKATISLKLNGKITTEVGEMIKMSNMLDMTVDQLIMDDPAYDEEKNLSIQFMKEYDNLNETQKEMVIKLMKTLQG